MGKPTIARKKEEQQHNNRPSKSSSSIKQNILCTQRHKTLHRKAQELEKLCEAKVCILSYDTNGNFDVWPKDEDKAMAIIMEYKEGGKRTSKSSSKSRKKELGVSDFLGTKMKKLEEENRGFERGFDQGSEKANFAMYDEELMAEKLSRDSLMAMESRVQALDEKICLANDKSIQAPYSMSNFGEIMVDHHYDGLNTSSATCPGNFALKLLEEDQTMFSPTYPTFNKDPTWPIISQGNNYHDHDSFIDVGCNWETDNYNGDFGSVGLDNFGAMGENYLHLLYNYNPPLDSFAQSSDYDKHQSADCEAADNLAANLMGFESCAEDNNVNIDFIIPPSPSCWIDLAAASAAPDHQSYQQSAADHDHRQPIISPLHEALPSLSYWPQ